MLRGRDAELELLRGMLARAREGESRVLVLRGAPGIGKTALLDAALDLAKGFRVLRARGVESESELAFAGLQELFAPVVVRLERLPERQRAVLAGALALGPPVPGDPLAVRAATLSILAAAAEDAPVLAVIDDAHWLDPPSAEALAFACRRLHSEGAVALFAMREAEPSAFDPGGLEILMVSGLADQTARAVLADNADQAIAPAVADRLVEVAGGNPLALHELPPMLSVAQLTGREPLVEPLSVSADLERAFARRLGQLPPSTRAALVVVAASAQDEPATVAAAIRASGLSSSAVDPAERAGLVVVADGSIGFRHPLLRSVVYHTASRDERRAAHAALAAASDEAADRRTWHLAAAAAGPDERVAAALEDAANRAAARGALSTAAHTFDRAARLSVGTEPRCRRLLTAANFAYASGRPDWVAALIEEGLPLAATATSRSDYQHLAGAVERLRGSMSGSSTLLWDAAYEIGDDDPARGTAMLIDAWLADQMRGDLAAAGVCSQRAVELAARCSPTIQQLAAAAANTNAVWRGKRPVDEIDVEALRALASSPLLPPTAAPVVALIWVSFVAEVQDAQPGQAAAVDRAIAVARASGALGLLPLLLGYAAELDFREDRWPRAIARASEAIELAAETGQGNPRAWGLVNLARVEAAQGHEGNCRGHAAEALALARALDTGSLEVFLAGILGLLELGLSNIQAAVGQLERCALLASTAGLGHPAVVPYEPDLVEALLAVGLVTDARAVTHGLQKRAERVRSQQGLATAARCRGLLADEESFVSEFEAALELHRHLPNAFAHARTQLCYGERLRRARRRSDARVKLIAALTIFEQLGAAPWAERARRELETTGFTARPRYDPMAADRLTRQELRVALMIAGGATNREAAAQLFLSPKTIEAHLARAYRKLGVRNRAQLVTTLTRQETTIGEVNGL